MPVLGQAIANHLIKLKGLYSVELPSALRDEILDLVATCNANAPRSALFVVDEESIEVENTSWAKLLEWRTDDDRVFVWERGNREPDSSFQSVVKPFISSRFPGNPMGKCSLDLLATLSIEELWRRQALSPVGDAFEAFLETAKWVVGALRYSFEEVGSTPSMHWSDEFLVHWARVLSLMDQVLGTLAATPEPKFAWDLVRVAGLPVPSKIASSGNPFMKSPDQLTDWDQRKLANAWQEIVEGHIVAEENRVVLLTALDWVTMGAEKISPWRGLNWDALKDISTPGITHAPVIGQKVFTSTPSPSLLMQEVPTYPVAPKPSWWGVRDIDIQEAIKQLRETKFFKPGPSCKSLVQAFSWNPDLYWLTNRDGAISYAHTRKRWKAEIVVSNLEMVFKETWQKLAISHYEPPGAEDGSSWIEPSQVHLEIKGGGSVKATNQNLSVLSGTQLLISFDLIIEYTAKQDDIDKPALGSWKPTRTLQVEAWVHDYIDGKWTSPRKLNSAVELIIPSPFSPTVLVAQFKKERIYIAPDNKDNFVSVLTPRQGWEAETTPDIILKEEGAYLVSVYDGCLDPTSPSFVPVASPTLNGTPLATGGTGRQPSLTDCNLDDGDIIGVDRAGNVDDVTVIRVRERSANLSSGLLSAIQGLPAGQKRPSSQAQSTLPGQYQVKVTQALCNPPSEQYNSLYQYVISTGEAPVTWPEHPGIPNPKFLFDPREGFSLPGIGNGPSSDLVNCPAWLTFMDALEKVCTAIGLGPGAESMWLSGFDPSKISGAVVKAYVEAHRNLVRMAKEINQADTFWASYPFSIVIVEGETGAAYGQLLAVLLSPLHPARLAWAFTVAFIARSTARQGKNKRGLIGLVEGWNIPYTGNAVSMAGQKLPMIAIPTDPGTEQDFATWSALAVLDRNGLAKLPAVAAGLPLPWGGQTGINQKVVEQALKDYLAVRPHINTLEIDIRSISSAPRSREIDEAVLKLVGGTGILDEVDRLGGGRRIQDSAGRLGSPPTRDDLFMVREDGEYDGPFEWRRYEPHNVPLNSDIAFIENSSVHLEMGQGSTNGLTGSLPLRRFCPSVLKDQGRELILEQNYVTVPGDDLLGLTNLLVEIEYSEEKGLVALQAMPQAHALGIGLGARWEILGTFNIDPALLSSVVIKQAQSLDRRLLWEWRPSWLSRGKPDVAKRPYYVIGRIPSSLLKALELKQGLSGTQAFEMLFELGRRGIGLTSLHAAGGTQESAAAGFFYSIRLLLPPTTHPLKSQWTSIGDNTTSIYYGLLPLDPLESLLAELADTDLEHRADLLAVRIMRTEKELTRICFVPIEVKHHGQETAPEPLPENSDRELGRARKQLAQTAELIDKIAKTIRTSSVQPEGSASCYIRLVGLATLLELAMSLSPAPPPADEQARVLRDVLNGKISLGVADPVLLWFAPGTLSISGQACIVNPHGIIQQDNRVLQEVFIDPAAVRGLWWSNQVPGLNEEQARALVDGVMENSLLTCLPEETLVTDIQLNLAKLLDIDVPSGDAEGQVASPTDIRGHTVEVTESEEPGDVPPRPREDELEVPTSTSEASDDTFSITEEIPSLPFEEENHDEHPGATDLENIINPTLLSSQPTIQPPKAIVGWTEPTSRWSIIGKMGGTGENVALDLDHPKAIGIFGYMGSGKSYLLGVLVEAALESIPQVNMLPVPLAVVIFNYRRNALDRFELSSLALPNQQPTDVEQLASDYEAAPQPVNNIHILCLPGELTPTRLQEYGGLPTSELFFNPSTLDVEDWEFLMGEPGSSAVFARTIRHVLRELRSTGEITLENLEDRVVDMLKGQSRTAAQLRFDFVRQYLSKERGINFEELLQPGRAVILDLRQPLFNKEDALRFFLICSNYVSRVQGKFNKLIVFDEAHEYLSNEFGEKIDARIRLMRHEGTSYIFATQDVGSIPTAIRRFITTRFVFSLGTRENIEDLIKFAPEFEGQDLQRMGPGYCLVQATQSIRGVFAYPRLVHIRPRVTQHGGASRIFSNTPPNRVDQE